MSDITGREQEMRAILMGASYGSALLAAQMIYDVSIDDWNPVSRVVTPRVAVTAQYDELYALYRQLYPACLDVVHALATRQER